MSRLRAPGAAQEQARRVIQHLLGSHSGRTAAVAVTVLVGLGWFTNALYEWLTDLGNWLGGATVAHWWPTHRLIAVGFFLLELLVLGALARGARKRYRPRVGAEKAPAPVHGLILFLSNLQAEQLQALVTALPALRGIEDFRARFGTFNWRMPIEAIAYHVTRLDQVVLICSPGKSGSTGQLEQFRNLLAAIFPDAGFAVRDAAQLDSRYSGGVDFEDVDRVSQATDDAYVWLLDQGLAYSEILIDVTGGQKTNAIAATAVALAEGRRIQYVAVDRQSGISHLSVYDVSYDL